MRLTLSFARAALGAGLVLSACSTNGASAPTFQAASSRSAKQLDPCPCLYVTNLTASSVNVYPVGTSGNTAPMDEIRGGRTAVSSPYGIAVNDSGTMYVANSYNVAVYPAGTTGNHRVKRIIFGQSTGLNAPFGIALDPKNGRIYVANSQGGPSGGGSVTVYSARAKGDVPPKATIEGPNTALNEPSGIAMDTNANVYVSNLGGPAINVYSSHSTGNAAPKYTIRGHQTGLAQPYQIAFDSSSNMYVANFASPYSITVYAPGAKRNAAPIRTVAGAATGLDGPSGVALDASGNLYVANYYDDTITVYPAGANGNVPFTYELKGAKTDLDGPQGLAIR